MDISEAKEVDYTEFVRALVKPGEVIAEEMTPDGAHLLHMAVGVAGEAGELLDAIKKMVIYNKPLDLANVIEELGDLEFYMEGIRQRLSIHRDLVISKNVMKLGERYKSLSYSDQAAQDRADKADKAEDGESSGV